MRHSTFVRAALFGSAVQLFLPIAARAQVAPAAKSEPAPNSGEIVVTAQKRSESVLNVPLSVTALGGQALNQAGINDFQGYLRAVPGLSAQGAGLGRNQVIIRGITTGYAQRAATVGQYIDGVPLNYNFTETRPSQVNVDPDLFDVQRVEVLRGPQGTLYGATALSGVLKIETNDPSLTKFEGRVQGSVAGVSGGDPDYAIRGLVSVPLISDKVGLRLVGYDNEEGGFIDNVATGKKNVDKQTSRGGRAILLVKPADGVRLRAAVFYQDIDLHGITSSDVDPATGKLTYGTYEQSRLSPDDARLKSTIVSLNGDFDLGQFATLSIAYGYQNAKRGSYLDLSEGTLFGIPAGSPDSDLHTYLSGSDKNSIEARLASKKGEHFEWLIGGFYTSEALDFGQDETELGRTALNIVGDAHYQEKAAFANATWHITDRWDLNGGVRYSATDQHFSATAALGAITIPHFGTDTSDKGANWTASIRYKPARDLTFYGRVATGFNPGSLNLVARAINTLVPALAVPETTNREELTDYEIGAKIRFWDGRATLNVSAFYIDWDKIQLTENTVLGGGLTYTANAGDATVKGLEFEATLRPIPSVTLSANGSYTDAKLTKIEGRPSDGETKGDGLPGVPHYSGSISGEYDRPITPVWTGFFGVSGAYMDKRPAIFPADAMFGANITLKSYETLDLRLGARTERYEIMVYAKNITNSTIETAFDPQFSQKYYGRPRTVGVRLDARF